MKRPSLRTSSTKLSGQAMTIRAWLIVLLILSFGAVLGYLLRGTPSRSASSGSVNANGISAPPQSPIPIDVAIQPLLGHLKQDPNNPAVIAEIGNQYYDHQNWAKAVEYYRESLAVNPENVGVRTDMATAIWYGGDPQGAIREYRNALQYQPNYAQTLFNMGIVQWQGQHDGRAALKSWNTLLQQHPEYPNRRKTEQLIQEVKSEMTKAGIAPDFQ